MCTLREKLEEIGFSTPEINTILATIGEGQEPVYQLPAMYGKWLDIDKAMYEDLLARGNDEMRILYTTPQPQQPDIRDATLAKLYEEWPGGFEEIDAAMGISRRRAAEVVKLELQVEEAQAKLVATEKDVARYQYLKGCVDIANDDDNQSEWWELHFEYQTGCKLDEAIDAAITVQDRKP